MNDNICARVKKCLSNTFINYRIKRCLDDKYIITLEYKNKTINGTICGYELDHIEDFVERLKRGLLHKIKESDNMSKVRISNGIDYPLSIEVDKNVYARFLKFHEGWGLWERKPEMKRKPHRYIINKGATILFWNEDDENDKTIVKLSKNDKYDKRLGFLIAYFQYNSGLTKTQANKYLDNLVEEDKKGK